MSQGMARAALDWPTTFSPAMIVSKTSRARCGNGSAAVPERGTGRLGIKTLKHGLPGKSNAVENRDAGGGGGGERVIA